MSLGLKGGYIAVNNTVFAQLGPVLMRLPKVSPASTLIIAQQSTLEQFINLTDMK